MRLACFKLSSGLALLAIHAATHSTPVLLSGFEAGLSGWNTLGDVSVQTAAVGLTPTQGSGMAFVTTLGSSEIPYSGTPSPNDTLTREFLGLPGGIPQFMAQMPPVDPVTPGGGILEPPIVGEGGAMTFRFHAAQAGVLSFDWDRIGRDNDSAFLSLWSDDNSIRTNDWIYYANAYAGGFHSSGVDLCSRQTVTTCPNPAGLYGVETGWLSKSVNILQPGWYTIGFGVGEIAEGTVPTVLALDNLTFSPAAVPEPPPWALLAAAALVGALCARARRARPPQQ